MIIDLTVCCIYCVVVSSFLFKIYYHNIGNFHEKWWLIATVNKQSLFRILCIIISIMYIAMDGFYHKFNHFIQNKHTRSNVHHVINQIMYSIFHLDHYTMRNVWIYFMVKSTCNCLIVSIYGNQYSNRNNYRCTGSKIFNNSNQQILLLHR